MSSSPARVSSIRHCTQCGSPAGPDIRFCEDCGNAINAPAPRPPTPPKPLVGFPVSQRLTRQRNWKLWLPNIPMMKAIRNSWQSSFTTTP